MRVIASANALRLGKIYGLAITSNQYEFFKDYLQCPHQAGESLLP
jgi:hypothetical protein